MNAAAAEPGWELQLEFGATFQQKNDVQIPNDREGTRFALDDLGVVPLLYFAAQYQINPRWRLQADFDGLAGGPGRAIDLSLRVAYSPSERWKIDPGYRGLAELPWFHLDAAGRLRCTDDSVPETIDLHCHLGMSVLFAPHVDLQSS